MARFFVLSLLTLSVFSTPLYAVHAARTTKNITPDTSIPTALADATVNLYCRFKVGKTYVSTSGSGVFVSARGVILTNAHVAQYFLVPTEKSLVKGSCVVRTGVRAKDRYTASVLYFPSAWAQTHIVDAKKEAIKGTGEQDFALLYVTGASKGVMPSSFPSLPLTAQTSFEKDTAVTILGYPTGSLSFSEVRSKLALVSAMSIIKSSGGFDSLQQDFITLDDSEAGGVGISGGPVLNSTNTIIGIATTKSAAETSRALRAITVPYIERVLQQSTTQSLASLLASNFTLTAATTLQSLPEGTLQILTNRLLKNR